MTTSFPQMRIYFQVWEEDAKLQTMSIHHSQPVSSLGESSLEPHRVCAQHRSCARPAPQTCSSP